LTASLGTSWIDAQQDATPKGKKKKCQLLVEVGNTTLITLFYVYTASQECIYVDVKQISC
jgi:hypothetical protein